MIDSPVIIGECRFPQVRRREVQMPAIYFEDVVTGAVFETPARVIEPADIARFSAVSGDHHPIHTDPAYASAAGFAGVLAHGPFGIAMAIGLFGTIEGFKDTAVLMTSIEEWRFRAPILAGDAISMTMEIIDKSLSRSGRGLVRRKFRLLNGQGVVVQEGISEMVVLHRPTEQ
jgi:acyl dehydratase